MDREERRKGTWSTEGKGPEFRGASDSVMEGHRPNIALDPGRQSGWPFVLLGFVVLIGGIGVAGYFLRDDIEAWFQAPPESDTDGGSANETTGAGETSGSDDDPAVDETGSESGEAGAPSGAASATGPTGTAATTGAPAGTGDALPHAWPPPGDQRFPDDGPTGAPAPSGTPAPTGAPAPTGTPTPAPSPGLPAVSLLELQVSGISKTRAESNLGDLAQYTTDCLGSAGASASAIKGELAIRMTIKWNGRSSGVNVSGDGLPSSLTSCVRGKLPRARYPQPRPGKDGVIRAKLKIGN